MATLKWKTTVVSGVVCLAKEGSPGHSQRGSKEKASRHDASHTDTDEVCSPIARWLQDQQLEWVSK